MLFYPVAFISCNFLTIYIQPVLILDYNYEFSDGIIQWYFALSYLNPLVNAIIFGYATVDTSKLCF
jgi:hypothetical protein